MVSDRHQDSMDLGGPDSGPVECLGLTFESEAARREHFTKLLREKLEDPAFRQISGFPRGSDEDILALSDPPYYTACPNPWLTGFVHNYRRHEDPPEDYHREPFAVDVSEGKTDQFYRAHGYHTKVPHLAIVPSLLHYTKPGDVVLDGFAGSGMTGVAGQWCGTAPRSYRQELERRFSEQGLDAPVWGPRLVLLNDLSPAASFIAANYTIPFDLPAFEQAASAVLDEVVRETAWMYETRHTTGAIGTINYTVWSEVFSCPDCAGEVIFVREALEPDTKKYQDAFPCPTCSATLGKNNLERVFETMVDPATGDTRKRVKLAPVLIEYEVGGKRYEKEPDEDDLEVLRRINNLPWPSAIPTTRFPIDEMYHGSRLEPKGLTSVHHLFLPRAAQSLARLWESAQRTSDERLRHMLLFAVEQAIWGMSVLNRYQPLQHGRPGGSQVNRYMTGVYYMSSAISEVSPRYNLANKLDRLVKAFTKQPGVPMVASQVGDCSDLDIPDASVDYIFTDPPFGANIPYADLNFVVEAFHGVTTETSQEAVIDKPKGKQLHEYQELMRQCFSEYHRVLKPGRWMTVVFSNSANSVWHAIQEGLSSAGFIVADVRTLDKKQGSYRQVTSTAVKQDLVISVYRPSDELEQSFASGSVDRGAAWAFVREHLAHVPVFLSSGGAAEVVRERTAQVLFDRMIAFFVQRGLPVPVGVGDFQLGLRERFAERDGMYFLSDQVAEYDRKRMKAAELRQLSLFVSDESSAIQWVRQQLQDKPQTFQDLQPLFMKQLQQWSKHEEQVELRDLLEENFLRYDGTGPVPSQIHSYLSTNFASMRNKDKSDGELRSKAADRWYVPDPAKEDDLQKLRNRTLLKQFEEYRTSSSKRLKEFRTEAVRAGFKDAYDRDDYPSIVAVAEKLPESVLQEDEKLLMYYDVAQMRIGA